MIFLDGEKSHVFFFCAERKIFQFFFVSQPFLGRQEAFQSYGNCFFFFFFSKLHNQETGFHKRRLIIPGTQMTLVLIGKDLVLECSTTKMEDNQVPGIYIFHFRFFLRIPGKSFPSGFVNKGRKKAQLVFFPSNTIPETETNIAFPGG